MDIEPIGLNKEMLEVPVKSFVTEKGSTYSYNSDGMVSGFKTVEQKKYPDSMAVFADFNEDEAKKVLAAIDHNRIDHNQKVYIVERQKDGTGNVVEGMEEIKDSDNLNLTIFNVVTRESSFVKPVSLRPEIGKYVFEYNHDKNGNRSMRHLGHKVVAIDYVNGVTKRNK